MSSTTTLTISKFHATSRTHLVPRQLKARGGTKQACGILSESLDYYTSALYAMSGWQAYQGPGLLPTRKGLFLDMNSEQTLVAVEGRLCTEVEYARRLDNALFWAYEEANGDGQTCRLIPRRKAAEFMCRYAWAKEQWCKPEHACIFVMAGLAIDPTHDDCREELRRLRRGLSQAVAELTSRFPQFLSSYWNVAVDTFPLEGTCETKCAICVDCLEPGQIVDEIRQCRHRFHSDCLQTWLGARGRDCPLCRGVVDEN